MTALTKVAPGAPLRIKAEDYNACLDAARAYRAGVWNQKASNQGSAKDGTKILISNQTGDDLDRLSVVELDGVEIAPEDNEPDFITKPIVKAVLPEGRGRAIAVLQEPAKDGALAMATISGIVAVNLTVKSQSHQFANVVAGETDHLESADTGPARIVYAGSGTGDEPALALVQIPFVESKGGGEPFARMGSLIDVPGVTRGARKYTPDRVMGSMVIPRVTHVAPIVPQTFMQWYGFAAEYGVKPDFVERIFAVDATQTGDTLDLHLVVIDPYQEFRSVVPFCTMTKIDEQEGSETYYWKGVDFFPGKGRDDAITIHTGYARHAIVSIDQATKTMTFEADLTGLLPIGTVFNIVDGPNQGTYTVESIIFDGSQTIVTTQEQIPNETVGGYVVFGGKLLVHQEEAIFTEVTPYRSGSADQFLPVCRDDASNCWIYYPKNDQNYRVRVGPDLRHPIVQADELPSNGDYQSMLMEHIPSVIIPKGCNTIEPMDDGTNSLRIRYRHHTSGDLYEGIVALPDEYNLDALYPLDHGIAYWKEYGTWVLMFIASFGNNDGYMVRWYDPVQMPWE